ncbi:MAG: hypothetical protein J6B02_04625 [Selenomonadales bacterium]|nr:hypothetical protein [Selenomonadales bacterium]
MTAKALSRYILALLLLIVPITAESAPAVEQTAVSEQTAPTDHYREARPADWAFVLRDASSATHLRMDTITRETTPRGTVLYGDLKKVYTKHGLLHIYYSLKNSRESDPGSLALLKQIDHSVSHVSYLADGTSIFCRLHRVTFYNKSGNPIETLDFDDIARQIDTEVEWQEVTRQMTEERAIFYRLANG